MPGNHELYKDFDINDLHEDWQQEIRPNVKVYYNSVIEFITYIPCGILLGDFFNFLIFLSKDLIAMLFTPQGFSSMSRFCDILFLGNPEQP